MFVDLHIHSWYSDSTRSPRDIIKMAKAKGVGLISVCDHNMIEGYEEISALCKSENIDLILGTEINSIFEDVEFHILAYDFDKDDFGMKSLMRYNQCVLEESAEKLISLIEMDYKEVSMKEFLDYERIRGNGGWKGIDYLKGKGIVKDLKDYIWLCNKYNIQRKTKLKTLSEITKIIHVAGGKAILAHPGDMVDNEPLRFEVTLGKLLEQGIDGFECYYTTHTEDITNMAVEFCEKNNLLITGGSDDHGGFNNIDGREYYIGGINININKLNISGIKVIKR
ncbi:MAG: PHP domain-containing protein [Filifactoraceae bacterium]